MTEPFSEGGCLCGNFRVRAAGTPFYVSYCHCRDCRKSTGAPVTVFVGYRAEQVETSDESRGIYRSSAGIQRTFCKVCGTPVSYEDERLPGEIYFSVGVFDEPEKFEPTLHGWSSQGLDWLHLDDELPRYEETSRPR